MRIDVHDGTYIPASYRCWVNGVEVTDDCFRADDEIGFADVYVRDENGAMQVVELPRTRAGQWEAPKVIKWTRLFGEVRLEVDDGV